MSDTTPAAVVAYRDVEGDVWDVMPGGLALRSSGPSQQYRLLDVASLYGPLVPLTANEARDQPEAGPAGVRTPETCAHPSDTDGEHDHDACLDALEADPVATARAELTRLVDEIVRLNRVIADARAEIARLRDEAQARAAGLLLALRDDASTCQVCGETWCGGACERTETMAAADCDHEEHR